MSYLTSGWSWSVSVGNDDLVNTQNAVSTTAFSLAGGLWSELLGVGQHCPDLGHAAFTASGGHDSRQPYEFPADHEICVGPCGNIDVNLDAVLCTVAAITGEDSTTSTGLILKKFVCCMR